MRYDVGRAGAGDEHRPDVGTRAERERWHVVMVFDADVVPTPPCFDTIEQALAYILRAAALLRIVGAWISTGSDDEQPLES